ncbi:hypothetical protein KP509_31G055100 [Ceratopteris richardii]|uniref:Uncharacterized protein n=1 Tax=Ceratopteris richardii TaxID=49495 RepID=A0A8T2R003_CERRI|nr:hypothetical protein KP509_31G055100 [Ceratopteris richardii]
MVHKTQSKKEPPGSMIRAAVDATSGAVAGGVSRTITSPLDVIKIRFQVQLEPTSTLYWRGLYQQHQSSKYTGILQATRDIVREEGIKGLWRGNVPALLMVMPYTSIQFAVLHKLKSFAAGSARGEDHSNLSPYLSYVSGALAGCTATIGSYPFDFLRTILASQGEPKVYPNLRAAFIGVLQSKGIAGLYAGLTPTLIEIIPYAGIQFGSYDTFKRWAKVLHRKDGTHSSSELSEAELFGCGLAAGITAKVFCHPLDVVKKRFQVEGLRRHPRYGAVIEETAQRSVWETLNKIIRTEGIAGLYKGLYPSLVKAAPASAITFLVYEILSGWLESSVL